MLNVLSIHNKDHKHNLSLIFSPLKRLHHPLGLVRLTDGRYTEKEKSRYEIYLK